MGGLDAKSVSGTGGVISSREASPMAAGATIYCDLSRQRYSG